MSQLLTLKCRRCGFSFATSADNVKDAEMVGCPRCKADITLLHPVDEDEDDFDEDTGEDDLARLTVR